MTPRAATPKPTVPLTANGKQVGTAKVEDGGIIAEVTDPEVIAILKDGTVNALSVYAEPELEPLPDTEAYNTFRAVTELVHGLGFDPNRVQTITLDKNGVRVFSRNAEGRNVAKMIRFEEVTGADRRRIVAEVVGE